MISVDPVTGLQIVAPTPLPVVDSIPLSQNPTPVQDIGGIAPIRRETAYPDDIIPIVATIAYGQKDQTPKAATYTMDAPTNQPKPVASLNVHITGNDAQSASSGGGASPVGYSIETVDNSMRSIGPSSSATGNGVRGGKYVYGIQGAWWLDLTVSQQYPIQGYLIFGVGNQPGNSDGVLLTVGICIPSASAYGQLSGSFAYALNPPLDLKASNLLDNTGTTVLTFTNNTNYGWFNAAINCMFDINAG